MSISAEEEHPKKALGWAARDSSAHLSPFTFSRRETGEKDVAFKVLYCGICHSDLHMIKNEWANTLYPFLPGWLIQLSNANGHYLWCNSVYSATKLWLEPVGRVSMQRYLRGQWKKKRSGAFRKYIFSWFMQLVFCFFLILLTVSAIQLSCTDTT